MNRATVTEIKNTVTYKAESVEERPARISDVIKGTDVLRTGERSLAEIEFEDHTIARLGSKTTFSLSGAAREYRVGNGLTLICVPKGGGGGRIVTSAISAAIEGTTVIAQEIEIPPLQPGDKPRRAGKMIFLEGNGRILTPDGKQSRAIQGGEMIIQASGDPELHAPQQVDIAALLQGASILHSFSRALPNMSAVNKIISRQQSALARGELRSSRATSTSPANSATGQSDPPFRDSSAQNAVPAVCRDVGSGFFLCTMPMPGFTCAPTEGGGFVCFKPH